MVREKCFYCNGTGEYSCPEFASGGKNDGWFKCEECNGTGFKATGITPNTQLSKADSKD